MRVYNRKKVFIGWVSEENGSLVLGKNADDDENVSGSSKTDSLYSVMFSLLFWMLAGDILTILGYAIILFTWEHDLTLPAFWIIASDNLLYMAPIGFAIQFFALLCVSVRYRRFLFAFALYLTQAVLAILVEYGVLVFDQTVFVITLALTLSVVLYLIALYGIGLRDDLPSIIRKMEMLPVAILAFLATTFGVVLYTVISIDTYINLSNPVDILASFGTFNDEGPGEALFFFLMTKAELYIFGISILGRILKKKSAK